MRKYLDLTTWIILFALAPLTILILLSQNTIPGDLFYPVKRGMENVVLAGASINPSTRVAFRTDLTQRRFAEAQQLLSIKADTTAFSDFVTEVSTTQEDLSNFQNQQQKIELSDNLIAKIDQYQNQLVQAQNQVLIAQESQLQNIATQFTPTSAPIQFTPAPTAAPAQSPAQTPQLTTPIQSPTETLQPVQVTPQPTPLPSLTPIVTTEIANNPQKAEEVRTTITNTQAELEKIKEKVKEQRDDAEIKQRFKEEQKRSQEESKRRGENGNNDH